MTKNQQQYAFLLDEWGQHSSTIISDVRSGKILKNPSDKFRVYYFLTVFGTPTFQHQGIPPSIFESFLCSAPQSNNVKPHKCCRALHKGA